MSNYDKQYYILFNSFNDNPSYLKPSRKTYLRNYEYMKLDLSGGPAVFENGFTDEDEVIGHKHPVNDVMDAAGWYLFSNRLYDALPTGDILGMQYFPAVFIDDDGEYHEDYVFTNFYEKLNCLDVENSSIRKVKERNGEKKYYIKSVSLSCDVLDKIPEEERLIFKLGQINKVFIIVHERVKQVYESLGCTGASFWRIDQYEAGDEYRMPV